MSPKRSESPGAPETSAAPAAPIPATGTLPSTPTVIEIPDVEVPRPRNDAGHRRPKRRATPSWLGWLLTPFLLLTTLAAVALILTEPVALLGWALALLFAPGFLWLVVSTLWPARADRRCPGCGMDALERMDSEATFGVRCARCGYEDAEESSWLMAEEEGPLEQVVLEQRRNRKSLSNGRR